ncbi:MAG: MlaD family protein, partial [Desulfobulbaceae bacterium]|nr:MlaD family protein [Desulfobulbaceae bacterium]
MSKKASPTLIGAFVFGAVTLGIIAVLLLAGGEWFQERRRHVMYFDEAAQGLQVGAPVVFLGVKVGTVKRVQLALDEPKDRFMVSVTIEI